MLNRLNGWQRIGVVLTALWFLFVLFHGAKGYLSVESGTGPFVRTIQGTPPHCTSPAPEPSPGQKTFSFEELHGCAPDALVGGTPDRSEFLWGELFAVAAIPPVLVWLLGYLLLGVVRWVAKGFRRKAT